MSVRIDHHDGADLIGVSLRTSVRDGRNQRDITAAWQAVMAEDKLAAIPGRIGAPYPFYGVVYDFDPDTTDFSYLIGVPVAAGSIAPAGYEALQLAPASYAVLTTEPTASEADFIKAIGLGWPALMEWLASSAYAHGGTPEFEYYDERGEPGRPARTMEIWLPVRPR
ncbi:GyrI-like domain-containing protein [Jeongeupia naejangsanensis]|uniref:AraC family transcriptional regulator n=1 Tax=Jeongeupia naejangsanensis TaxID=613195 RepID=A0ABS2BHE5_9NEIS|nr:GyrI-like domain-containing protein [Jeongeupia naejangsanensis]MBM3115034.1 AraC family transcriptional regulator [Jeongeupia naejangsanensis]